MKRHTMHLRCYMIAGLAGFSLLYGGCATASKSTAMVAAPAVAVTHHPGSLAVNVTGGGETSSLGASNISNEDFAEAIKASIAQSGLFAEIAADTPADYQLDAQIVRLDRPSFGLSFTVNLEVTWKLIKRSDQQVVWQKAISSSFTATTKDAFAGVTRLRMANEGAARANIQDAIARMSALSLPAK